MATSPGEESDETSQPSSPQKEEDTVVERPSSYVSPSSTASHSRGNNAQNSPTIETRRTIDFRKNSADSDMPPLTPEHQFGSHPTTLYDSDASDGSIVFSFPAGGTAGEPRPGEVQQANNHDRFPSFDSMASNESFRLTGSRASPRSIDVYKTPPSPPIHTPVQFLPYTQRRKLMERRQQMQQQQQIPPPPFQSPQVFQQQQQQQRSMQKHPTSGHGMRRPNQHFQQPPHPMHYPPYAYLQQPMPVPYMMGGPMPIAADGGTRTHAPQQQQPQTTKHVGGKPRKEGSKSKSVGPVDPTGKPPYHSLPPSGHARALSGAGGGPPRSRTASADSNGSVELESSAPPRPQRPSRAPLETPPPPPGHPPPLPAQHVQHIRGASSGSISSLGSATDKPSGEVGPRPVLEDYHFQNQELLQRSEYDRVKMQQAMQDTTYRGRPPSSPRSSQNRSVHRDLSWEEMTSQPMSHFHPPMDPSQYDWRYQAAGVMPGPPHSDPHQHMYGQYYPAYPGPYGSSPPHGGILAYAPPGRAYVSRRERMAPGTIPGGDASSGSFVSESGESVDESSTMEDREADERTSLLPPSGISTHEQRDRDRAPHSESWKHGRYGESLHTSRDMSLHYGDASHLISRGEEVTRRWDNRSASRIIPEDTNKKRRKRKGRKQHRKRRARNRENSGASEDSDPEAAVSSSSGSYRAASRQKVKKFEKERARLIAKWKAEAIAEAEEARTIAIDNRWHRRLSRGVMSELTPLFDALVKFLGLLETFLSNLPLTIGAVALSIVTLGVVWFKFAEENLQSCAPVHFHSSQCTFPEFPGCFFCDRSNPMYRVALNFHFTCSAIAGILAFSFIAKVTLAPRVVLDEMSSPTTSSPAGLLCMTTVCVFAGRGWIGQCLVSLAASLHLCLAIWFLYICLAYHILPEPSWFPNTVGIGLSAVKTWLYYPMLGHLLMAVSLSLNFFFFPISLIRVTLNKKMSATVCWIQMSAPAVSLYALTIMAQPSFVEEHPDVTDFQRVHRMVYLPLMHFLFALACIGVASSIQSLWVRWDDFRKKAFSPAHAAFCFPTLAHANAIQAYRAAINTFADLPLHSPFRIALYSYWVTILVSGTLVTLYITAKFMYHLPGWTQIDVADEEEPPAPYDTILTQKDMITTGETLSQPFVSPAVLQANETGALVMISRGTRDGRRRYRRTRQLTALGFEPIMDIIEMDHEREVLLDWVGKHPPRRRTQTLSVPGIDFNYGFGEFGVGNTGVYGETTSHVRSSTATGPDDSRRPRSQTTDFPPRPGGKWRY